MRRLVGTFLVGVSFVAGPALAQQHPWVADCVYTGGCMHEGSSLKTDTSARAYGRIRSGDRRPTAEARR
jgi:hypothetical protein